jgi:Bardet-Biedl syndrome 4 protein
MLKAKDRTVEADAAVSMDHPPPAGIPEREQVNWLINQKFVRQEYGECLLLIEQQLRARKGMCEYSLYMKALLLRMEGRIPESLALFQAATCLNPTNAANLKQVGRCLHLMGKHKAALDVYDEADKLDSEDWEVWHNKASLLMLWSMLL